MDIRECVTINCKRGDSVDVPLYKIRPWKLQKGISNTSGTEQKVILAYMIQVQSSRTECNPADLIAASVEVEPAEYKRIVDLKQRVMAEIKL